MTPRRPTAALLLLLGILTGCGHAPHAPDPIGQEWPPAAPGVGVQVWNHGREAIRCAATLSPIDAEGVANLHRGRLDVPSPRFMDPALGGDPDAAVELRFPVSAGRWRLHLETPRGHLDVELQTPGKNWLVVTVTADGLSAHQDTGPRYLE